MNNQGCVPYVDQVINC